MADEQRSEDPCLSDSDESDKESVVTVIFKRIIKFLFIY